MEAKNIIVYEPGQKGRVSFRKIFGTMLHKGEPSKAG